MPLSLNTNISALNAARSLNATNRAVSRGIERLSSGLRINSASDDPAGLSVREGMRAELSGLRQAVLNAEQATNLIQTAEGSLNEVNGVLIRLRELATQSSSSTVTDSNRTSLQSEFSQLVQEIDRIASATTFNNQNLLTGFGNTVASSSSALTAPGVGSIKISTAPTGTFTFQDSGADSQITLGNGTVSQTISVGTILDGSVVATGTQVVANFDRLGVQVTLAGADVAGVSGQFSDGDLNNAQIVVNSGTGGSFQVGATSSSFDRIEVSIPDMRATGTQLNLGGSSISSISTARSALTSVDSAVTRVAQQRGDLGAVQNRLSFNTASTNNQIEHLTASESSISDADIVAEITALTRAQILAQAATAMLAQANVQQQSALALLTAQFRPRSFHKSGSSEESVGERAGFLGRILGRLKIA